jgi:hypothetical protein
MSALPLDVTAAAGSRFHLWFSKKDAAAALRALQARGLNVDPSIELHPTRGRFGRGWVIGRPDHFNGVTYLMTDAGAWVMGRLTDATPCYCATPCRGGHAAPWADLRSELEPAPFTHVTRTVISAHQTERYKTKSNGSCGRYVRSDNSVALCTCGWKAWESTRDDARVSARAHLRDVAAELAGVSQ